MRAVLDTNTALALWWFEDPTLAPLAAAIDAGAVEPIVSPEDQKFLECAWFHRATWLITRDRALLALARHRAFRPVLAIVRPEAWVAAYRGYGGPLS